MDETPGTFVPLKIYTPRRLEDKYYKPKARKKHPLKKGPRNPPEPRLEAKPKPKPERKPFRIPPPAEGLVAVPQTTPEDPVDLEVGFRSPLPSGLDQFAKDLGGRQELLKACCLIPSRKVAKMLQRYNDLPANIRGKVNLESLCLQVDIEPESLVGNVVAALWKRGIDLTRITNSKRLVEVMESSIAVAKRKRVDCLEERRLQFEIAGLVKGQGSGINIFNQNVAKTGAPGFEEQAKSAVLDGDFEVIDSSD